MAGVDGRFGILDHVSSAYFQDANGDIMRPEYTPRCGEWRSVTDQYPYPDLPREDVLPHVPFEAGSVLDVGCGSGGFGASLRQVRGDRVLWGIESDPDAAERAADHYDRIIVGHFPDVLAGHEITFDCVAFNDVLEHMVDPWDALRQATGYLSADGVVVASIPNVRFLRTIIDLLFRGDWAYTDTGVLDRTHLRFFTRRTIIRLFSENGYNVETVQGTNWLGHARGRWSRIFPLLLRDFAYTGFVIRGRPDDQHVGTKDAVADGPDARSYGGPTELRVESSATKRS